MKLYDTIIRKTTTLLASEKVRAYAYNPAAAAKSDKRNGLILAREAAFELGESTLPSVSYTLITDNEALVSGDRVLLIGKDLNELTENTPFARVTILLTDNIGENDDQEAYAIIKNIEMKKYDVYPIGYMMRASALSNREQARVSKDAIIAGLRFEQLGNLFISKYKENSHVKAVMLLFITLPEAPYAELERLADESAAITRALNHMLADIHMDCHACEWKPVCDEVAGMKEMHAKIAET